MVGFDQHNGPPDECIFTEKPSVNIISNGKTVNMAFAPIKNISIADTKNVWEIKGSSDKLQLAGTLSTEYDGFSLYKFAVKPLNR